MKSAESRNMLEELDPFELVFCHKTLEEVKRAIAYDGLAKKHRVEHFEMVGGGKLPYVKKYKKEYLIGVKDCEYYLEEITDELRAKIDKNLRK